MSLPVTVYRWDDPGAPQLTNALPSEFISVLITCLVNGYGDKPGAGWTLEDISVDNLTALLRNSTSDGSGSFLHLSPRYATDTAKTEVYLRGAPLISELHPDFNAVPNCTHQIAFEINNTSHFRWIVIATGGGFYFGNSGAEGTTAGRMGQGTNNMCSFLIGDLHSYYNGDMNRFNIYSGASVSTSSSSWNYGLGYVQNNSNICYMGQTDGVDHQLKMQLHSIFPVSSSTNYADTTAGEPPNQRITSKLVLGTDGTGMGASGTKDVLGVNCTRSDLHPSIRGELPGVLLTQSSGYSDFDWPVIRNIQGHDHFLIPSPHVGATNMWINMESWYD